MGNGVDTQLSFHLMFFFSSLSARCYIPFKSTPKTLDRLYFHGHRQSSQLGLACFFPTNERHLDESTRFFSFSRWHFISHVQLLQSFLFYYLLLSLLLFFLPFTKVLTLMCKVSANQYTSHKPSSNQSRYGSVYDLLWRIKHTAGRIYRRIQELYFGTALIQFLWDYDFTPFYMKV